MNVTQNLTSNLFRLNSLYKYFQTQRTDVSGSRGICLDCDIFQWLQYFTSPSPTPNIPILSKARKQWAKVEPGQSVLCFIMGTCDIRHGDNLGSWFMLNVNLLKLIYTHMKGHIFWSCLILQFEETLIRYNYLTLLTDGANVLLL